MLYFTNDVIYSRKLGTRPTNLYSKDGEPSYAFHCSIFLLESTYGLCFFMKPRLTHDSVSCYLCHNRGLVFIRLCLLTV